MAHEELVVWRLGLIYHDSPKLVRDERRNLKTEVPRSIAEAEANGSALFGYLADRRTYGLSPGH